jgi:hypothetical protein
MDSHHSDHKRVMIRNKTERIYEIRNTMRRMQEEYLKEESPQTLQVIAEMYVNEYLPEIHNLRLLKYGVMEMNEREEGANKVKYELFQKDATIHKIELLLGEPPRVISYKT